MNRRIFFTYIVIGLFFCNGCAAVNVGNMADFNRFVPEDDEQRIWKRCEEMEEIFDGSGLVYGDKELNIYLTSIVRGLLAEYEGETSDIEIKVKVLKDHDFNASMLANGTMYVHTGLLANMDNEAQIAVVLAHEIAHYLNRHSLKSFRSLINKTAFFSTALTAGLFVPGPPGTALLANVFLRAAFLSSATGYSRRLETEADTVGFSMFAKKYDISEASKAFENLARAIKEQDTKKVPYFFNTHPKVKNRIKNFRMLCREYQQEKKVSEDKVNKRAYEQKASRLLLDNARQNIKVSRFKSAERSLNKFLELYPESVEGVYWLGELCRNRNKDEDKEKALTYYKNAIEKDDSFALAYKALGIMHYKDGKDEEAVENLEKYLAIDPQAEDKGYIDIYLSKINKRE